jgi:hypothetical protein
LDLIAQDITYDVCQLEEDMCTGLSKGISIDIDLFITEAVTLNCIEAMREAEGPLQASICAEHGTEYASDDLDRLLAHILYGTDVSGNRIWATEFVGKLKLYSRFGLSAQVELVQSHDIQRIDVQEPQADTVAHIVLLQNQYHYDILYEDSSTKDYKQVWQISCCMDEFRTRLMGPYPDRTPRHKYLSSAIIDRVLSHEHRRSSSGVYICDSSMGNAILAGNYSKCEQMLSGEAITADTKTLLLPINIDNLHYVLAIVDIQSTTVWLYDPLGENEANLSIAEQISAVFGHHLKQHFDSRLFQGPLQGNSYDCGILVINTVIAIDRGNPSHILLTRIANRYEHGHGKLYYVCGGKSKEPTEPISFIEHGEQKKLLL